MKVTAITYCQHLITTQTNYTCQYYSDRVEEITGDRVERYLKNNKLTPNMLWEKTKEDIIYSANGCIIFDDTVLDHNHSRAIEIVRKQWSGNQHRVIRGIGVIGCLYYNPDLDRSWLIDYRIFDPETDGLTKIQHAMDMFNNVIHHKQAQITSQLAIQVTTQMIFEYVLFDAAYATKKFIALIDNSNNKFLCNIKSNRRAREIFSDGSNTLLLPIKELEWDYSSLDKGKLIRLKDYPLNRHVKLFRVTVSPDRTDYIITNDITLKDTNATQKVNSFRWNIESFHREIKQITGIEACQCRKNRSQRNHINLCLRAWLWLKIKAVKLKTTVYQLKQNQLDNYYIQEMKNPTLKFSW